MYKLIIVDDEEEVRQGIIDKIDWAAFDFEVIGQAENGREALDIIEENVPDVVITDICMPLMDGLELAGVIRESFPTVKMVILTGFDEFKFAQQAIRHGVADYILKPVLPRDINELMQKLKSRIEQEIEEKEDRDKLRQHYIESLPILKDSFLSSLLTGPQDAREIAQKTDVFGLNLSGSYYTTAVVSIDAESLQEGHDAELMKFAVLNIAQEIVSRRSIGEAFFYDNMPVIIAGVENDEKKIAYNRVYLTLEEIRQNVEKFLKLTITAGVGSFFCGLGHMKESYHSALTALEYKLVLEGNKVISVDDLEPEITDVILLDEKKERALITSIKFGSEEDVADAVDALFEDLDGVKASIRDYQIYFIEVFAVLSRLAKVLRLDVEGIFPSHSMYVEIGSFNNMDEIKAYIKSLSLRLMDQVADRMVNSTQVLLEKAQSYIDQNYQDPDLTIQKLADHLFISASYLSLIFKKEAGQTFLKYLISVRLEAAKAMLRDPETKVTEVAEKVGYPDVSYFSYFFKKNFGVSPREYRSRLFDKKEQAL